MAPLKTMKTAVIGCGVISHIYLKNLCETFKITEVVGCSDIIPEKARKRAEEFGIRVMTNEEIYNDPEIEIVVNLTYPTAHFEVTRDALLAGKHVYSEKMLAVELAEGEELVRLARKQQRNLTVAPDSFLGGGLQTARWIIDSGMIGVPILANGICQRSYQLDRGDDEIRMIHRPGGGIPFDMGGYYLHAFVNMFGPLEKIGGFAQIRRADRVFYNPYNPLYGDSYRETCINTVTGSLQFKSGVLGSLSITSESVQGGPQKIEIIGMEGTLYIHDPNDFFGPISVKRPGNSEPLVIPYTHPYCDANYRGIGVVDMAYAVKCGRAPRADAALGLHAFEAVHKLWESSRTGTTLSINNQVERPAPLTRCGLVGQSAECVFDEIGEEDLGEEGNYHKMSFRA